VSYTELIITILAGLVQGVVEWLLVSSQDDLGLREWSGLCRTVTAHV